MNGIQFEKTPTAIFHHLGPIYHLPTLSDVYDNNVNRFDCLIFPLARRAQGPGRLDLKEMLPIYRQYCGSANYQDSGHSEIHFKERGETQWAR